MTLTPDQLCATNFSYLRCSLDRWLEDMTTLEVRSVELWGVSPHLYVDDTTPQQVDAVRRKLEERELNLTCFCPEQVMYPVNIAAADPTLRDRSIAYFHRCAEVAAQLGAPILFCTSGWNTLDENLDEAWERSRDALASIAEKAASEGLTCVLEALQPVESHIVTTSADIARMREEIGAPNLKVALDTGAMVAAGETVRDYTAKGDLHHVHFVDGSPTGHLAWGDGDLPLATYLEDLDDAGYEGFLSLETIADRYWLDPLPPVRQSFERITAAMAERTTPAR
jgi:protein FrlC